MADINLENAPRPDGQRDYYRFFRNAETGQAYKAKHEPRTAFDGSPALCISVSPVDAEGKALRDPRGEPDVYYLTHTFTAVELADPDFNLEERVSAILHTAIGAKEEQLGVRTALVDLGSIWSSSKPIPLPPPPPPLTKTGIDEEPPAV